MIEEYLGSIIEPYGLSIEFMNPGKTVSIIRASDIDLEQTKPHPSLEICSV